MTDNLDPALVEAVQFACDLEMREAKCTFPTCTCETASTASAVTRMVISGRVSRKWLLGFLAGQRDMREKAAQESEARPSSRRAGEVIVRHIIWFLVGFTISWLLWGPK